MNVAAADCLMGIFGLKRMSKLEITLPLRLASPMNGSYGNWRGPAARRKLQRGTTKAALMRYQTMLKPPVIVTITRIGKRKLDSDNLQASAKSVRDGVADAFGVDDGDEDAYVWRYAQEKGKDYGVRIEIEGK